MGLRYAAQGKTQVKYRQDEKDNKIVMPGAEILRGTCDVTNTLTPSAYMQVNSLLDAGAVLGNYCSRAVGDWVHQHRPECWRTAGGVEEIALATEGASTTSLGSCFIILKGKNSGTTYPSERAPQLSYRLRTREDYCLTLRGSLPNLYDSEVKK
jgi:hypothetical protein